MMRITVALTIAVLALPATARELKRDGAEFIGKTIWTNEDDLTEIGRFPLKSKDPSFIVYVESLHPEDSDCSREEELSDLCLRPDLCHIWVEIRDDLQPVKTEPIQEDQSRVLVTWVDEETRDGNGHHMNYWHNFDIHIEARNGEVLVFHSPLLLDYAPKNQACFAGVRLEYNKAYKTLFNRWPPR